MTKVPVITERPAETLEIQHTHAIASTGTMGTVVKKVSTLASINRFLALFFFLLMSMGTIYVIHRPGCPYRENLKVPEVLSTARGQGRELYSRPIIYFVNKVTRNTYTPLFGE